MSMKIKYIEIAFEGGDILEFKQERNTLKQIVFLKRFNSLVFGIMNHREVAQEINDILDDDKRGK